jgi:hypothetical protein
MERIMDKLPLRQSTAWTMFTYLSFGIAAAMMAGGIYFLEASFAAKGFYAMAALMLVHTTVSITKAIRDSEEAERLHNKIDEARTERLLMEVAAPRA